MGKFVQPAPTPALEKLLEKMGPKPGFPWHADSYRDVHYDGLTELNDNVGYENSWGLMCDVLNIFGIDEVRIAYGGTEDSGNIKEPQFFPDTANIPHAVISELQVLSNAVCPGNFNNEGCHGHITLNIKSRKLAIFNTDMRYLDEDDEERTDDHDRTDLETDITSYQLE